MKIQQLLKGMAAATLLLSAVACGSGDSDSGAATHEHQHQPATASEAKKTLSPRTTATANIGENLVHIDYSSPSVRGRVIWGGLVAYDQVWVTGAHKATSIEFSGPVRIGGQPLPAGKYGIFTIPGKEEWVVILNTNHDQHLVDEYDADDDAVRLRVTPEITETPTESLTYEVMQTGPNTGEVSMKWEKIKIAFPVEVL